MRKPVLLIPFSLTLALSLAACTTSAPVAAGGDPAVQKYADGCRTRSRPALQRTSWYPAPAARQVRVRAVPGEPLFRFVLRDFPRCRGSVLSSSGPDAWFLPGHHQHRRLALPHSAFPHRPQGVRGRHRRRGSLSRPPGRKNGRRKRRGGDGQVRVTAEEAKYTKGGKPSLMAKQFGELTMAYMDGDTVPFLWRYANRFVLFDHIFQSMVGPSTPGKPGNHRRAERPDPGSSPSRAEVHGQRKPGKG